MLSGDYWAPLGPAGNLIDLLITNTTASPARARRQVRNLHRETISQYAANKASQVTVRETQVSSDLQSFLPFNTSELSDGLSCEAVKVPLICR